MPLKNIGKKAAKTGRSRHSPVDRLTRYHDEVEALKWLTPSELQALFSVIKSKRDEALFRVMYCKGLRASEPGLMQLSDWNDNDRLLYVRRLKGSRCAWFPMHDRELRALRAWLKVRGPAPGAIFLSRNHRPISRQRVYELMRKYCQAAGISEDKAHPHVLKHSRGTHLYSETGRLNMVQDALGHRDAGSTVIYSHFMPQDRDAAVKVNQSKY